MGPADSTANDSVGASVALSSNGGALGVGGPGGAGDDEMTPGEADVFEARTLTTPSCQPGAVGVGQPATCTATVTDYGIGEATPTGTVSFSTDSSGGFGAGASCTLSEGSAGTSSCQVTYTPGAAGSGSHAFTASYSGDDAHAPGIAQTMVAIGRVTTSTSVSCSPPRWPSAKAQLYRDHHRLRSQRRGTDRQGHDSSNGGGPFGPGGCSRPVARTAQLRVQLRAVAAAPGTHQLTAAYAGEAATPPAKGRTTRGRRRRDRHIAECAPLSVSVGNTTRCT